MENQKKLEETISRFKKMHKIAHVGYWELFFSTGKSVWSDAACEIYGITADNNIHVYEEWESFVHPDDLEDVKGQIELAQQTFTNHTLNYRIVRKDGKIRHLYSQVEYQFDKERNPTGLYGVVHDITDIVNTKDTLLKSEINIRLLMDLIPMSIYARDADGYYLFGNHIFLNHYGITADELKSKHLRDLVTCEEEHGILRAQDQQVLSSDEKLFVSEFKQKNHTGEPTAWRIIKVPFTPVGHTKKAILGIAEDITTRKKQEEELIDLTNSLTKRNNDLERFSQMVSHDLRGPLATLMGASDMIDNIRLDQDELALFINGIKSSLLKIDNIVRVLNDITALHE
jgi:PAS domain S-box-containing protein